MGIFDIFNTDDQQKAAQDQIAGLNAGNTQATGNINQAIGTIGSNYTSAMQPYLSNFSGANAGTAQLGNVLGLNGPTASNTAQTFLENTPGYQFQKQQGDDAINAQAAATGMNASGNQALALSKFNQGLAGTTYNNYVSQLQPYLGAANSAAGGIANTYTGQGNAIAGQQDQLANLNFSTQTGIGNANANADLAGLTASGNFWNMLGGIGGMKTTGGGTLGGNAVSGAGSALMSMFSDERLKEDIEPVGELYDGTNIYRYRYIGDPTPRIGVMAQEVEKTNPGAVTEIGGYKAVDYSRATQYASELARFLEAA